MNDKENKLIFESMYNSRVDYEFEAIEVGNDEYDVAIEIADWEYDPGQRGGRTDPSWDPSTTPTDWVYHKITQWKYNPDDPNDPQEVELDPNNIPKELKNALDDAVWEQALQHEES